MLLLMYRGISNGNIKTKEQMLQEQLKAQEKLLARFPVVDNRSKK